MNPKSSREKIVQIAIESFSSPGCFLELRETLAMISNGRLTGTSVKLGYSSLWSVPIYEGHALRHGAIGREFGGKLLDEYLAKFLNEKGFDFPGTEAKKIVRDIREQLGYIVNDFDSLSVPSRPSKKFTLPDGEVIELGNELYQCNEALFQPGLFPGAANDDGMFSNCKSWHRRLSAIDHIYKIKESPSESLFSKVTGDLVENISKFHLNESNGNNLGLDSMVCESITRVDRDLRGELLKNIVLSGGLSTIEGLSNRLWDGIQRNGCLCSMELLNFAKVIADPEYSRNAVWMGGSIFAGASTFDSKCITKEEYDEKGPAIVHTKCF